MTLTYRKLIVSLVGLLAVAVLSLARSYPGPIVVPAQKPAAITPVPTKDVKLPTAPPPNRQEPPTQKNEESGKSTRGYQHSLSSTETKLESNHFTLYYDPRQTSAEKAKEASLFAEAGWPHDKELFGEAASKPIYLYLNPSFIGATGMTSVGSARRPARIYIRFNDLDYLGITGSYVFTHEIAHVFSGPMASTPLGEGIADWAAGSFANIPLQPWWGRTLRNARLWVDPDGLFITGKYPDAHEVTAANRTAQYAESALLVKNLVERFGWATFKGFMLEYAALNYVPLPAQGRESVHISRVVRIKSRLQAPDFEKHFGVSWDQLKVD